LTVRKLRCKEKYKSESSGPLREEMPEVVAASGRRATILPKWPLFSLPPTDLERIRVILKSTEPSDRVFSKVTGKPAKTLSSSLIADLLNEANLREGTLGVPSSTCCFRHAYAALRLQEGVEVYFLAEQIGISVT
jgi:integrase